ncbi:MAG TPA: hypothetical protein VGI70_09800, partial [Polyangiales bacterium]
MNRSELPDELERAARCVDRQPNALELATFAHDVLASWADTRSLSSGQRNMAERAADYDIDHDNAATELGNLLQILERGPRGDAELSLIAAFALRGFDRLYAAAHGGEHQASADRFVAQLDWLELATDYRLTPFAERLLGIPARRALIAALSRAIGREDLPPDVTPDVGARARNAARLTVLAGMNDETAVDALRSIRRQARDPATRVLALALGPEGVDRDETLRVVGISRTPSRSVPIALLRWFSGFALLSALHRFACFLIALRRDLEVELRGDALQVRSRTSMLGRTLRSTEACYDVWRVTGAFRRARFALLRSVIGVLSLSIGVLLGGYLVFDGARGGAPMLLVLGAAVVAVGSSVDLALN